ncbi:MAG: peptide deformylase [Parcubacteria group bacterium]|nr:peptide deformylase [Parcubacteria group bacterium]
MVKIVQKSDPVLRETAKDVVISDIQTPKIQKILKDMKEALASQEDGVAIAAPQIGESLRIFVISGNVFEIIKGKSEKINESEKFPDIVFINPKITKLSKEKKNMEEGCLSVRYLYGKVERSAKASIEAYDEKGKFFKKGGSGLMAQIFQHEVEHLDGVLFIDKAKEIEEIPPETKNDPAKKI